MVMRMPWTSPSAGAVVLQVPLPSLTSVLPSPLVKVAPLRYSMVTVPVLVGIWLQPAKSNAFQNVGSWSSMTILSAASLPVSSFSVTPRGFSLPSLGKNVAGPAGSNDLVRTGVMSTEFSVMTTRSFPGFKVADSMAPRLMVASALLGIV